jgi:UDP-N-acetylglucosamine diphosphorylase / glucose-1-phosphate thymidylyltransferase / UDP-N-acetylgalactosamine diphosphorylase / glucosamine-1-phosphate N-acetyltransferase / galactosamine-1-phosphate N-acetyltransferase
VNVIVMAAGEGTRLRPLTERWPKPVLPIDGRPVLATLLHELRAAGCGPVWVVVGYLAEQVERLVGDGSAFDLEVRLARQPGVLGSADAVQRALDAGAGLPALVVAADTVFRAGDVGRFAAAFTGSGSAGAIAVRRDPPPGPGRRAVRVREGRVEAIGDEEGPLSGAPLWVVGPPVAERLCLDREPYELENAYRAALAADETILAVEIGKTRDLTDPLDLVEENFPYLSGT